MTLPASLGLILLGLALLAGGGEVLVRGATSIARLAGVTPAVIGLTVVAVGTSLPELVVSLIAARQGQAEIAVANVVGSNIFNLAGVLGMTALLIAIPVEGSVVKIEWPFMFLVSCLVVILSRDGELDRAEGGMMLVAFPVFTWYMVRLARVEVKNRERREFEAEALHRSIRRPMESPALSALAVLAGLGLLLLGGRALIGGAVSLARLAGLSERIIGLTVVAAGTGAPELAASIVAALRGRADVAVANLIGSNIFNILGILGITALYRPLQISGPMLNTDMVWMMITALALFPVMRTGMRVSRFEGVLLVFLYVAYITQLIF